MSETPKQRRRKYRTGCDYKNLKQLILRLPDKVTDLIEMHSYDEMGRKLSQSQVVADMICFAAPRMLPKNSLIK